MSNNLKLYPTRFAREGEKTFTGLLLANT